MRTAVILTAIQVEGEHVISHLTDVKEEPADNMVFHVGRFRTASGTWRVAVAICGEHNVTAALATERAVRHFSPVVAMFVGVAGGIKDVSVGDVVVATKLYDYESAKIEDGGVRYRPDVRHSADMLVQQARAVEVMGKWPGPEATGRLFIGPIASGGKLLASVDADLYAHLRSQFSDAVAVEMEGHGFMAALSGTPTVQGLVVRGISDLLARKAESDAGGSQVRASAAAAAIAFAILSGSEAGKPCLPFLHIPECHWDHAMSPPGALLRAEYGIVPFHGREEEVADIAEWCAQDARIGIRLYTGAGGMGKTRLFIELCHRMRESDWTVGFVDRSQTIDWQAGLATADRLFIVIDYAETRQHVLEALLAAALRVKTCSLRIILIARAAGDWWEMLKGKGGGIGDLLAGGTTRWHQLRPLALTRVERQFSYDAALDNFSRKLDRNPVDGEEPDVGDALFDRVLLLHMQALAAVDGVKVKGEDGILDYVLKRERTFWRDRVMARGLPETLVEGVSQAMAVLTLGGGARTHGDAMQILAKVPLLADQPAHVINAIIGVLHGAYPGDRWVEPLLPDLLGEHLVEGELARNPDDLLDLVFGPPDPEDMPAE